MGTTMRRPSMSAVATFVTVAGAVLYVIAHLHPTIWLANTTANGGDMGAHVWMPAYLRDHLLTHGRLTGWTPDWYAGFPVLTFYFPLPSILVVLFDLVLPYAVAFKLVTGLGVVTLPVAAWGFGRLAGLRRPVPACLAVAMVPFLFERTFTIYGGNMASTLAGEFAFSISLSLCLVFLGVFARSLDTGRYRALAATLLGLTILSHVVPTLFALLGALVLFLMRADRKRLVFAAPALAAGTALAGFWAIPFVLRIGYTNDMGWEKFTNYANQLFLTKGSGLIPQSDLWLFLAAFAGAVVAIGLRQRIEVFVLVMTVLTGIAFCLAPQGRLWNARLLPFWFLGLYLLAAIAVAEAGRGVAVLMRVGLEDQGWEPKPLVAPATSLIALAFALFYVAIPLNALPGGRKNPVTGLYTWPGRGPVKLVQSADTSFIDFWVKWNYSGYERKPSYPEYHEVVTRMQQVGRTNGCGRAMWEYEPELDRYGTPMALMLLPYWTNGCVGSMEGLFFESSATTPYHFLNQSELSVKPSSAQRDLPYRSLDVAHGVQHLQLLGVKYYMAISDEAKAQAAANPDLTLLATTTPYTVTYGQQTKQRSWAIYEVRDAAQVQPLAYEPTVVTGLKPGAKPWLQMATTWYQDPTRFEVPLAQSGPPSWARVRSTSVVPTRHPLPEVKVTNIKTTDDRISFDVDRVGVPVLVKSSYFPNWQAGGAKGPWRVTPNQMVVIPTSRHVSLHYGTTPVDYLGWLVTLLGLAGVVWMARRREVDLPTQVPVAPAAEVPLADDDGLDRELAIFMAGADAEP
jgi:hypothetical protein